MADIAHTAGYRIEIVNDETGEVLGVVEPPCLENSRDALKKTGGQPKGHSRSLAI